MAEEKEIPDAHEGDELNDEDILKEAAELQAAAEKRNCSSAAADVVGDTFLSAVKRGVVGLTRIDFKKFCRTVSRNKRIDLFRSEHARKNIPLDSPGLESHPRLVEDPRKDPYAQLLLSERRERMRDIFKRLPKRQQILWTLMTDGLTDEDIANYFGISRYAARRRRQKLIIKVKKLIRQQEGKRVKSNGNGLK